MSHRTGKMNMNWFLTVMESHQRAFNQRHEMILFLLLHKISLALVWTNKKTLADFIAER